MARTGGREWLRLGGLVLLAALWVGGTVVPAQGYEAVDVADGGTIAGKVVFKGTPPKPRQLEVTKDKQVCARHPKYAKDLVVGKEGGVQWAVVWIEGIKKGKPFPDTKPVLDQHGCEYVPHVLLAPAGRPVEILNSDGILHNIHTYGKKNPPVNRAQPKFKKKLRETFRYPEIVKLTCDVHGWMKGWLVVMAHPYYAVTDASGAFRLTDVPPGDYELHVWQETLGEKVQKVGVQPGAETQVTFELTKG